MNSCGRDKVVILWDLQSKKQLKTVALYESLEAMVLLPEQGFFLHGLIHKSGGTHVIPDGKACVTVGGENGNCIVLTYKLNFTENFKFLGKLQIWTIENNTPIYLEQDVEGQSKKSKSITNLIYNETRSTLAICYNDNTVLLQSFGQKSSELTVCKKIYSIFKLIIYFLIFS